MPLLHTCCTCWLTRACRGVQGDKANEKKAQEALLTRAQANSKAQLGEYDPSIESEGAGEKLYEKGYKY